MQDSPRILIVEDDREILLGMSVRLRAAGYEVVTACDGQAGLAEAKRMRPDAIVLDIRMPVMDGLAVLAKLGEDTDTKTIPVVVLSANVAEAARRKALDLGARYFLEKPYDAANLLQAIKSALNHDAANPPVRTARDGGQQPKPAKTVLIADDDGALVKFLTLRCQDAGLTVRTASNGLEALTMILEELPDLAILDVNMPAADGLSVCERLMTDPDVPPFPVILLTGKSDEESIRRCQELGAHYVHKGIDAWGHLRPKLRELIPEAVGIPAASRPAPPAATVPPRPPKVLIIDDDPTICRVIRIRLEAYGIEVTHAVNGTQGFWMALKELPDVVVTDLHMSEGCGNYLLGRLKATDVTKDIVVIFLTGHKLGRIRDYGLERDLMSRGAATILSKPLDFDILLQRLRSHIIFSAVPNNIQSKAV